MVKATRHLAIAGAGIAGRLLAWRMSRCGWRVSLFDGALPGDTRSASHVAAAMLAPLAERASGADDVVFALACRAMALWPAWIAELQAQQPLPLPQPLYFRRDGTLVLAHPADGGMLAHFDAKVRHRLPAEHLAQVQRLDAAGVAALEPSLAGRFEAGLLLRGEGQLANDELLAALRAVLGPGSGVDWHEGRTVHTLQAGGVVTDAGTCAADVVVDTRGVGARPDWPGLRGVRGELLVVACPGVPLQRPVRLMHPRYQLYIAPRPGGRFVVGATELESQDDGPATLRSVLELGSALHSLHPAFGEARVLSMATALRPAFDDHRPALRVHQGVWQLNGLYRHGYLCGPALVDEMVQVLTDRQPAPSPLASLTSPA
jgi:glycine oxidase